MSDVSGKDPRRTAGNGDAKRGPKPKAPARVSAPSKPHSDVGRALRSVYDATLGERVPDDFLDLLGKLN